MYSIKEQDLLFPWQTFIAFLMILSAMQFTMLRPQEVQASVYKEKAEQIKPIVVTPVAPVKPKFLQIIKTDDEVRYNKQDLFCMAKNIYHEAGSEPTLGKYAVAQVTINRMKSPMYKDTVCSVVFEPYQFSWANYHGRRWTTPRGESWIEANRIARDVLENNKRVYGMGSALFYHATYVRPYWASRKDKLIKIGLHIFYAPRS
jgi:spore germination cell wall hydrolase CwlJ-like protein